MNIEIKKTASPATENTNPKETFTDEGVGSSVGEESSSSRGRRDFFTSVPEDKAKIIVYNDGKTGEVRTEDESGKTLQTFNKEANQADFFVSFYPGAVVTGSFNTRRDEETSEKTRTYVSKTVTLSTSDSSEKVRDYYARELKDANILSLGNNNYSINVNVSNFPSAEKPMILISIIRDEPNKVTNIQMTQTIRE